MNTSFARPYDDPPHPHLGGKGRALAALSRAGFAVPAWFAVTPDSVGIPGCSREAVDAHRFDSAWQDRLDEALRQLDPSGDARFAVRSSASDEDGAAASFAGQLDSFLNVPAAGIPGRIADVWRSLFSERLAAYRREQGLPAPGELPTVLVQRMVPADRAGVAFSADAVSGRRGVAVVAAVRGLGERLVSGEADADTWRVLRDGEIESSHPAQESGDPCLTGDQVREVAELARRCERFFGCPQDIEWAIAGDRLHLLQSRPVTTLRGRADPDGARNLWDNSNIAESYGGVTTPLTFSFAHMIYREVYEQFCRVLHVSESAIADNRRIFDSMLGLIRGRVYYNLMSWYRMLALLPGFHLNRRFMEQMMGVSESLPSDILAEIDARPKAGKIREAAHLSWSLLGLLRAHLGLGRSIRRFYHHFSAALDSLPVPLETMRPDELVDHFHTLEEQLLRRWDAPLVNDFFAMIYFGFLRKLTQKWCDDEDGTLQNGLLCGTGNIVSAEPARRIREMAEIAAQRKEFVETLTSSDRRTIEADLQTFPEFARTYQAYLDRFADRCLNELKLESATLRDDPLPLLRSVGGMARRLLAGSSHDAGMEARLAREAEATVRARLRSRPHRRVLFGLVVRQARRRVQTRENLRFERTRLFGRIRHIFVELGRRLAAEGSLEDARDVFYLRTDEVIGFVEGTTTTTDLRGLVRLRREEFDAFARMPPPADRFETRGTVHLGNLFEPTGGGTPKETGSPDTLQGIGCCPGRVRGPVRVVRDPAAGELREGEILVAEQTDPGWITLFPSAAAVLVQRGSLLSHSAIVAREMGIPAIVSVPGLLDHLQTGDVVEMDGAAGSIRRLPSDHD